MKIKKYAKIIFSLIFFYLMIVLFIYLISAVSLTQNKILNYKVLKNYQRNFYNQIGYRKIWNANTDCVEFDEYFFYKPKLGDCLFKNVEFETKLTFSKEGRVSENNISNNKKSIAVLGDSFAMGWGVDNNKTFSSLLEKKLNKKVYNLGVASYATEREIQKLKNFESLYNIDTIIIQYCLNDIGENVLFSKKNNSDKFSKEKFNNYIKEELSIFARIRKIIRYSVVIPFEVLLAKDKQRLDWLTHQRFFEEIIKKYSFLSEKEIIVIYVNEFGKEFYNFPNGNSLQFANLRYLDIEYNDKDFFLVDGHLNEKGHQKVSNTLFNFIKTNNLKYN